MREELSRLIGFRGKDKVAAKDQIREIPIELIKPNPYQPRETFDEESLGELSASIKEHGVLQPVIVRQSGEEYELVVGERRLRACRMAGLSTVPAIVRDLTHSESAELSLIENLQRRDLTVVEEINGYERLIREFGLTQQELAKRVGKGQSTIANKLRLLKLPTPVLEALGERKITERHARALLKMESEQDQVAMVDKICKKGLTVGQTEALIDGRTKELHKRQLRRKIRGEEVGSVRAIKDIRLFLNTIKDVVGQLKATGVRVTTEEVDDEDVLELRICITKSWDGAKRHNRGRHKLA
jgi:ParB family chromosome partitioning protein